MKIGLVGCGRWGRNHAGHLKTLDCDLFGIADTNPKVNEVTEFLDVKYFCDYKEMLDLVDAVDIVSPTNLHYETVRFFLEGGKHVFVEKPAADTAEKTEELVLLAKSNDLVLNTGYLHRFNPAVQQLKERLVEVGQIRYISATNIHERAARTDSGVIVNLGIHPLDVILFLTSDKPHSVNCSTVGYPLEKAATLTLDFGSYLATVNTACEAQGMYDKGIKVVGENCTFEVDFTEQILIKYLNGSIEKYDSKKVDMLREELNYFIDCVKGNKIVNIGNEDLLTARICDAALKSSKEKRRVYLE